MAENVQRSSGIPGAFKLDRGNAPTQVGMYIGEVRQVLDSTRSGQVKVWIEDFAGPDKENPDLWRPVSPVSPFYGTTNPPVEQETGEGNFTLNKQSYGMWFTPPDIGTLLICFFASGDSNYGYYLGAVVQPGINHMLPAIGASRNYKLDNSGQQPYFNGVPQLPVVELNINNQQISENPKFYNEKKPVHSVVAAVMLQQGLIKDPIRGPINSNAQRESPSTVYGISTPGRPIYLGGMSDEDVLKKAQSGALNPQDATVIARRGGHSFVMDDGDISGNDALVRIRTAKGHQITMSDSGDCFFIIHSNGQTWLEFGNQGTVDIYSTNSINLRSNGDINLHADRSINMNAKGVINIKGERALAMEGETITSKSNKSILMYSKEYIGIKSDGTLSLKSNKSGTWNAGSNMVLSAGCISLNGGDAPDVPKPGDISKQSLPDTKFEQNRGWVVQNGALTTIVTRAPTHQPYPLVGRGINNQTELQVSTAPIAVNGEIEARIASIQNVDFSPIQVKDFEVQAPANAAVGSIQPDQVTAMLAQRRVDASQNSTDLSEDGLGEYKLTPAQLEDAGLLKPGTVEFYLTGGTATATDILTSPQVWTGQNGVNNVTALLSDRSLQASVQTQLYNQSLQQLRSAGVVTGSEDPVKLAGLVQAGSKYGADTVKNWIQGKVGDLDKDTEIGKLVRGGQYAVQLANQKISNALKGYSTTGIGSTSTVNRTGIDAAVSSVIGNAKVTTPNYTNPFTIYSNVSDADLTYRGDNAIVLANINAERRRRGLPPIQTA
jgi:hypothetical protein